MTGGMRVPEGPAHGHAPCTMHHAPCTVHHRTLKRELSMCGIGIGLGIGLGTELGGGEGLAFGAEPMKAENHLKEGRFGRK
jgi:hypothetical protein